MRFSIALVIAASAYRVSATAGIGLPFCMAGCLPLMINPIAYSACTIGCGALTVSEGDDAKTAHFMPDGSIVFEKGSPQCTEACKVLVTEPLTHAACLGGCAAGSAAVAK